MKRTLSWLVCLMLSALAGCASTTGSCARDSICPIVIYEPIPGAFATYPRHMEVKTGTGQQTLVWTFADTTQYVFGGDSDSVKGDGVELIGANGSVIGLTNCFITRNSRADFRPVASGPFLRCEIVPNKDFPATSYRIRFHSLIDGKPRSVDPTVSSTGGGSSDNPRYLYVQARLGDAVTLPPKTSGIDGVVVIWDSATDGLFSRWDVPMVFKDGGGQDVDLQPCTPSADSSGQTSASEGRYYVCYFLAAGSIALDYTGKYTDTAAVPHSATGKVSR